MENTEEQKSVFEKNMEALYAIDPLTTSLLQKVTANEKFEIFISSDPANINFVNKENFKPLFVTNPVNETMKTMQELSAYALYPHLYFFGLGNGVLYRLLLNNNEALEHLVIIEPEAEILYNVFHFFDFSEEIKTRRVEFHIAANVNKIVVEYIFGFKTSSVYSKLYDLRLFNSYYGAYRDEYLRINKLFTEVIESVIISYGNDSNDSVIGLKHLLLNVPEMLQNPSYQEFVKKAQNTSTAIIVSTGPSLYKQLPLLKEVAPYVTIFCIDASFPILTQAGIKPDIVLTLERVEESAKFYTDTPLEAQDGVIFAITAIAHKKTLNAITRGQKILPMRPFPYTFYLKLEEYGYVGIGMSAANMAYEAIRHSDFSSIVFIGQDLAFGADGTSHSKGAVYGEREVIKEIVKQDKKDPIMLEAYGGGRMVESTYVWRLFLKFFELDIAKTPPNIDVINATEGGARIHGANEHSFKEVVDAIDKSQVKKPIILKEPTEKEYEVNKEKITKRIESILHHGNIQKAKVEKIFLDICSMTEELERLNKEQQLEKINFKKMDRLVDKINAAKNNFIKNKHMRIFDNIVQSYMMHQEMELAKISTRMVNGDIEEKARKIDWIYAHKYWFFSLAGGIDTVLEVIKDSVKEWMDIPEQYLTKEIPTPIKSSIVTEDGVLHI